MTQTADTARRDYVHGDGHDMMTRIHTYLHVYLFILSTLYHHINNISER